MNDLKVFIYKGKNCGACKALGCEKLGPALEEMFCVDSEVIIPEDTKTKAEHQVMAIPTIIIEDQINNKILWKNVGFIIPEEVIKKVGEISEGFRLKQKN